MNRSYEGSKRREAMQSAEVQKNSADWWNRRPMDYDWYDQDLAARGSAAWFDRIDRDFLYASKLFATKDRPLDQIIPLDALAGKRVLEIGCGMGFHTETMARAGARVTAVDLTETGVAMTRKRLEIRGLSAEVLQGDAESLPFEKGTFDFVWSWGVIHHSSRTGRIVREIARVLKPDGEARIMVYNREGAAARTSILLHHFLRGGFLRRSMEETLYATTDGFSARFYVKEQFEDLFRTFFEDVTSQVCGQHSDVVPLPRQVRAPVLKLLPESYQRQAQAKRGAFLFLTAKRPV